MAKAMLNKLVPDVEIMSTNDAATRLAEFRGKTLVLYFYPKDNTPGCTVEGQDFRDSYAAFKRANAEVVGVSRDSIKSHDNFRSKHALPFPLISDPKEVLCNSFNVIKEKNMYGKKVMGIERSTFLIDANGVLRKEWRKVKVEGHVNEVLASVKALNK